MSYFTEMLNKELKLGPINKDNVFRKDGVWKTPGVSLKDSRSMRFHSYWMYRDKLLINPLNSWDCTDSWTWSNALSLPDSHSIRELQKSCKNWQDPKWIKFLTKCMNSKNKIPQFQYLLKDSAGSKFYVSLAQYQSCCGLYNVTNFNEIVNKCIKKEITPETFRECLFNLIRIYYTPDGLKGMLFTLKKSSYEIYKDAFHDLKFYKVEQEDTFKGNVFVARRGGNSSYEAKKPFKSLPTDLSDENLTSFREFYGYNYSGLKPHLVNNSLNLLTGFGTDSLSKTIIKGAYTKRPVTMAILADRVFKKANSKKWLGMQALNHKEKLLEEGFVDLYDTPYRNTSHPESAHYLHVMIRVNPEYKGK